MSLQVWLPLIGDMHNQGIDGGATISGTPSYSASGKLGNGCLNTTNMITIYEPTIADKKVCTFAFWAYITSSLVTSNWTLVARICDKGTNSGSHIRFEVCPPSYGNGIYCFSNHNNDRYAITTGVIASKPGGYYDQWVHFCFTSDGTTLTRYMNGVKEGTCTYDGPGYFSGYFDLANNDKCFKQDVRIYNHCLSAKEVKEISKGLICHYLMNQPEQSPNLSTIPSHIPDFPNGAGTSVYSLSTDGISRRLTCTTAGTGGRFNSCFDNSVRLENTTYTWSIDIRASKNMSIVIGLEGGGEANLNITTDWQRLSKTAVLLTNIYSAFVLYPYENASVGDWIEVKCLKVEKNNFSTPWSPCSSDYPKWSDNIEYDCSGYKNNGAITGSGSCESNSPRYSCSFTTNGTGKISSSKGFPIGVNPVFTVNFWLKSNEGTFTQWNDVFNIQGSHQIRLETINTSGSYFGWYNYPLGTASGFGEFTVSKNVWYMITLVSDGSKFYCYKDASLYNTTAFTGTGWTTNGAFTIGDSSGMYVSISDVRIYSTALSSDDIKELYTTSASVDKNGNMYAYEFKEE